MIHLIEKEWSLPGLNPNVQYAIFLKPDIFNLIQIKDLQKTELEFERIAHKDLDKIDIASFRYIHSDISFPGIVVNNMNNPKNKEFRMIDGRHRLLKQMNLGMNSGMFYILDFDDVKKYIVPL